jgi:2-phosphosulfolactate phosphatase
MQVDYMTLETCAAATESVVVVDVWRSFTTAAYVLAAGARDILVVASTEEALALRSRFPEAVLMGLGKLGGEPAPGFDYGNSPAEVRGYDWRDRRVIQCTPNGTPGLARSVNARTLVAGSLVCARATVSYLKRQASQRVTFVCTEDGIADQACAEYMTALLGDEQPEIEVLLGTIRAAGLGHARTLIARGALTEVQGCRLEADLNCCLELDLFDFALVAQRRAGVLVLEALRESSRNASVLGG